MPVPPHAVLPALLWTAAAVSTVTTAATAATEDATAQLPAVVVSASYLPLTEASVYQNVTVYQREDLEREVPGSIGDFLFRRAGVATDRGFGGGRFGSLYLRGADPSHVVVLVDGVRQNDPLSSRGSAVDLNTLTLDDVERIEVVRGTSAVTNPEALAGVVHIITRAANEDNAPHGRMRVEAGGRGLRAGAASISGGGFNAGVSHREDSDSEGGGYSRVRAANLGARHTWGATRLAMDLRFSESTNAGFPDDSGGPRFAAGRALERRTSETRQLAGALAHRLSDRSALELRFAHFSRDSTDNAPAVSPGLRDPFGLPATNTLGEYQRNEAQLNWRWSAPGGWEGVLGAGSQVENGRLDSTLFLGAPVPANFSIRRMTNSAVGEVRRTMGPWTLQAGWRHEQVSGGDALDHPAFGAQLRLPDGLGQLGGALSSASKLPSFYALGHPLVGNPALKPERSRQAELYWSSSEERPWKTRLTVFHAQYRDLVDFESGPPPRLVNRQRIESTGIEWSLQRRWKRSAVWFEGTWMHVSDPDGGRPLRLRPDKQAALGLEWQLQSRLSAQVSANYVGRRFDSSIPTADRFIGGFTEVNLGLNWRPRPAKWSAYARVENVFDRRSEEIIGTPLPARRLKAGIVWTH